MRNYALLSLIFLLLFLLTSCKKASNQQLVDKDTIVTQSTRTSVPEVEDIPGMKNGDRNRLEDVLPYYQDQPLYQSISEALEAPEKVQRLRLRGLRLTTLPSEIFDFENLRELDLSDNNLTSLPDSFGQKLKRLEILDLSNNQFASLPQSLIDAQNLGYLNLQGNQLTNLPSNFNVLSQLQWLDLSRNRLKGVPEIIFSLNKLKNLMLNDIPITDLPQDFVKLKQLKHLSLRRNTLKAIPAVVFTLTSLEELVLAENQLSEVELNLTALKELTYLNLANNQLTSIAALVGLPALTNLNLSGNPITGLPTKFFESLASLKALNLAYTKITELSSEIKLCKGLVWLSLQGTLIEQPVSGLAACERLRVVLLGDMPEVNFQEFLQPLKGLKQLHTLRLVNLPQNDKKTVELPEVLFELKSISELDLRNNRLADAPKELEKLAALTQLQAINLANCGIRNAHPAFQNLSKLKVLGLDLVNIPFSEVQKLGEILPPNTEIIDGTEFFSYKYWLK